MHKKTLMLASLIAHIRPSVPIVKDLLQNMKLLAILAILYKITYQNNNSYFLLLIALYLYLARARIDAIILPNYLGLTVLYKTLQRKLKSIASESSWQIKIQALNCKFVGIWNNFKQCENVYAKKIDNKVKFCSITIVLQILNSQYISEEKLKQLM